jgi:virginiamycin A acetyltransferase
MNNFRDNFRKFVRLFRNASNNKLINPDFPISRESLIEPDVQIMHGSHLYGRCLIGRYTYIGFDTHITRASVGRYVSIGSRVSIGPGEHDLNRASTNALFYENAVEVLTKKKECRIESDAWLGVQAIILRGVTVGIGAVVGANAVVTKDVPNFAVVVGSPAKIIKYRFNPAQMGLLLASKWWELDLEPARKIMPELEKQLKALASPSGNLT